MLVCCGMDTLQLMYLLVKAEKEDANFKHHVCNITLQGYCICTWLNKLLHALNNKN